MSSSVSYSSSESLYSGHCYGFSFVFSFFDLTLFLPILFLPDFFSFSGLPLRAPPVGDFLLAAFFLLPVFFFFLPVRFVVVSPPLAALTLATRTRSARPR